jgi:hypothetical protein
MPTIRTRGLVNRRMPVRGAQWADPTIGVRPPCGHTPNRAEAFNEHTLRAVECSSFTTLAPGTDHQIRQPSESGVGSTHGWWSRRLVRGSSVLRPAPTPSAPPWTSVWPYTRTCSASIDLDRGCGRVSPVRRSAFAACRLLYAGAVPGCSRIHGPDYCLHQIPPGSARSSPHGISFRRGRVRLSLRPAALLLLASPPALTGHRRLTSGLLWRLARAGLTPAG